MGASKEMFNDMREKEYTINTTFKLKGYHMSYWENNLRECLNVIDFKIVSNTEELYANDAHFKKLVKLKKTATKNCELYINKHN